VEGCAQEGKSCSNLPATRRGGDSSRVHFCHGAAGAVLSLLAAYRAYAGSHGRLTPPPYT